MHLIGICALITSGEEFTFGLCLDIY